MEDYIIEILSSIRARKISKRIREDNGFLLGMDNEKKLLIINRTAKEIYNFCDDRIGNVIINMKKLYPSVDGKKIALDVLRCLRDLEHRDFVALR